VIITLDNPADVKFLTRSSLIPIISDQITDLELNFLITDTLFINVQHKVQKMVKVEIDSLRVPLVENHRLVSRIDISPDTIIVVGPTSMINALPGVLKIDIPRRNINDNFNRNIDIELPASLMSAQPDEVKVQFAVAEFTNVTLPVNLDMFNFPEDSSAYLTDSVIYINYWVRADELNTVKPEDFVISADYTMMIKTDSTLLPILLESPTNAFDMEYFPDTLRISYARGED
jgi:YbbR domain-containing protein